MLLQVKDIHVHYNQVAALKGISLSIEDAGFITLIGSNGAGKSTTLRTISGLERANKGEIILNKQDISTLSADAILKLGIAHVPEGRRIFKDLTVIENLYLGAFTRDDKDEINKDIHHIFDCFPRLRERQNQSASTMSGGEQQMLAIGRALMSKPKLLLLDEPSLGLAPIIVQEIAHMLSAINLQGVAIILVEQNADLALKLARHAYVLETGNLTLEGQTESLMNNEHVRQAYLGI